MKCFNLSNRFCLSQRYLQIQHMGGNQLNTEVRFLLVLDRSLKNTIIAVCLEKKYELAFQHLVSHEQLHHGDISEWEDDSFPPFPS